MVKTLNIPLDDEDYNKVLIRKGNKTWKEYLTGDDDGCDGTGNKDA